ncbi:MAG: hypothetical protein IPH44_21320 [Myxococcales bacterium]|nr:hypothetical protein [Myxococcales bacterium]
MPRRGVRATSATDTKTLGELTVALLEQLASVDDFEDLDGSPLVDALAAALFTTPHGLEARRRRSWPASPTRCQLLGIALPRDADQLPGVVAPPGPGPRFEEALADVLGRTTRPARWRWGCSPAWPAATRDLAKRIAAALDATDGAGQLLVALAEVRARTAEGAAALAPMLAADAPVLRAHLRRRRCGPRAAGRSPAWAEVRGLLGAGHPPRGPRPGVAAGPRPAGVRRPRGLGWRARRDCVAWPPHVPMPPP